LFALFELRLPIVCKLSTSTSSLSCFHTLIFVFIFILLSRSDLRLYLLLPSDDLCVLLLLQASTGTQRNLKAAVPTQKNSFAALALFTF
jgi:hypothetical protein